jgi:CheY-like chemotaxis protein
LICVVFDFWTIPDLHLIFFLTKSLPEIIVIFMKIVDKQTIRIPTILSIALIIFSTNIYLFYSNFRENEFYLYLRNNAITLEKMIIDKGLSGDDVRTLDDMKENIYTQEEFIIYDSTGVVIFKSRYAVTHLTERLRKEVFKREVEFKKDGYDVTQSIRNEKQNTPILMLTAMGTLEDKSLGFDAGIDDFLVKPFQFQELLMRLNALYRRSLMVQQQVKSNIIKVADLEINHTARIVLRGDKEITLTAKEYALLEYLVINHNRVVSRVDIAEKYGMQTSTLLVIQ